MTKWKCSWCKEGFEKPYPRLSFDGKSFDGKHSKVRDTLICPHCGRWLKREECEIK